MNSPFKFLDSYTREDRDIFFGRDREIEELYQKVFENRILLIYGVSGTGKTSLINCGLANKFEDSDWLPVRVRRGGGIMESLWRELKGYEGEGEASSTAPPPATGSPKQYLTLLRSVYLDHFKPLYLIFDQFEELFIFGDKQERKEFVEVIRAILNADVQCKILISIREEYLASITEFENAIPDIMQNRMRVEKMSHANALQAITGPCKVHDIGLEEGFPEALLERLVPEGNEVELTYLQVYLDKIYKQAAGDRQPVSFRLSHLEKLGNVGDLLGSFLEEQITQMEDPDVGLAILKSFVSVKGTKRQITNEEVKEASRSLGKEIALEEIKELVNKFVDLRILREKDENGRYELRHDSLAAKIFEKITLVEKEIMEIRLFIENAYHTYENRGSLLSQEDLDYIALYEDRLFLVKELHRFIEKSKDELLARKRSFNRVIGISIAGCLLMILGAIYYYYQKQQNKVLEENVLMSFNILDSRPLSSINKAFYWYDTDTMNSLVHKVILQGFNTLLQKYPNAEEKIFSFIPEPSEIKEIELSQDGLIIYGWLEDNEIRLWDMTGREMKALPSPEDGILHLRLAVDNQYLGVLMENETIRVRSEEHTSELQSQQ